MSPPIAEDSTPWPDGIYSIKRHGVTIQNCDSEPIRTPGCIQSHGAVLVLRPAGLTILQASENSEQWLGVAPENLLGASIQSVIGPEKEAELRRIFDSEPVENNPLYVFSLPASNGVRKELEVVAHLAGGSAILEFEQAGSNLNRRSSDFFTLLKKCINRLHSANNLPGFCQQVTDSFQTLTGMDRVMLYRFHEDFHGEVIAESRRDGLPSWLGLHYPAEDIPKQAREIFMKIWHRAVPDIDAPLIELIPLANPDTGRPVDMTYCALRGVSIMYSEYIRNMGSKATLVMPVLNGGRLWGLISCHHGEKMHYSYRLRAACEFLAQVVSLQLKPVEDYEQLNYRVKLEAVHGQLVENVAKDNDFTLLCEGRPALLDGINAGGAALYYLDRWWCAGQTPGPDQLDALAAWLFEQPELRRDVSPVFAAGNLLGAYPDGEAIKDTASGLLAIPLSHANRNLILWFRPEIIQTINWAGDPHYKLTVPGPNGLRLTPRASFELYTESVQGHSLPWTEVEIDSACRLRQQIMELVVKRADQLAALNSELSRSNEDLDTFTYVASHDLKEPLRGISKYAHHLLEEGVPLGEDDRHRLEGLMRLTSRMDSLLDALLHFSRLGRARLELETVNLDEIVEEALEITAARRADSQAEIIIPRPLPEYVCDRIKVREIFVNLIANALKYNNKPVRRVEIGYWRAGDPGLPRGAVIDPAHPFVFYVRDNGIGMEARHFGQIFKIFKRLHARDAFGGGTGAGLSIVRLLVEKHQGETGLVSATGEGTTFFFSLGNPAV